MVMVRTERRRVQFGPYCANLRTCELTKHGARVKLQARPFQILNMLLERPGEVVTRGEIRERLWPDGTFVDFDSNISSAVRKLRDSLCDSAADPRYVETVGRVGYRFIAAIESVQENSPHLPASLSFAAAPSASSATAVAARIAPAREARLQAVAASEPVIMSEAPPIQLARGWLRLAVAFIGPLLIAVVGLTLWSGRLRNGEGQRGQANSPSLAQEAEQQYSLGREYWSRRGEDALRNSIQHFELAIKVRPDSGLAYSGLADAYMLLPMYSRALPAEAHPKARAAALKAVELSPRTAEAHTSLAYVKLYADWDFNGAEEEFKRALQLNPKYPTALQWYAEFLSLVGRQDAAIAHIHEALQLMPNSPVMHHNAGQVYQAARRYDDAITEYRTSVQLDPSFATSWFFMGLAYNRKGMYQQGLDLELEAARAAQDPTGIAIAQRLEEVYQSAGREAYLREVVAVYSQENPERDYYRLAECYALLGLKELALQYLEKIYESHDAALFTMNVDPELDSLRSDPRFIALRHKVGLPAPVVEVF